MNLSENKGRTIVVVPCFNESKRLDADAFTSFCRQYGNVSFLFVDDGSRDRTGEKVLAIRRNAPEQVSLLRLSRNFGKAEAVRKGMIHAVGFAPAYFGFWDADLATPLNEIPRFLSVFESRPDIFMVTGTRIRMLGRNVERSNMRHYIGRLSATLISLALRIPCYDSQCGAKIFKRTPQTEALFNAPFFSRWLFDVEILARLIIQSSYDSKMHPADSVFELPLLNWGERTGSKIRVNDYFSSWRDLMKIRRMLNGRKPRF